MRAVNRFIPVAFLLVGTVAFAQPQRVPRPPVQSSGEAGSTAPDGYAPIPQWAGQTRASAPSVTAKYRTETVARGIRGGFCFHFLPDGRLIVGERPGRIRIVDKAGVVGEPLGGLPPMWARGPQGLFEVLPDRNFAANRTIYLTY